MNGASSGTFSGDHKVILVLGPTGAGKTSFIDHLVVEDLIGDNVSLSAQTTSLVEYFVEVEGESIMLVDTPGIDSVKDVFEEVMQWMSRKRPPIRSIDGIILLYPIDRNRLGISMEWYPLMCGFNKVLDVDRESSFPFHRVVLATTMWPESLEECAAYVPTEVLLLQAWTLLERQGMKIRRGKNTREFAMETLSTILTENPPETKVISARDRLIVAVIGLTHSGKSSFIAALTNDISNVNDLLSLETVLAHEIQINGENVILLDTPGLGYRDDREAVFKEISRWLKHQAKQIGKPRLFLDGIVLTHPVVFPRASTAPTKEMMSQTFLIDQVNVLLGGLKNMHDKKDVNAYRRVVLATTMWDKLEPEIETAKKKEEEIRRQHWNIMRVLGAPMVRFDNTAKSARQVVQLIVEVKKSGDTGYQYRKIMREIGDLKSDMSLLREEVRSLRRE